jgi:hypothetical protein
MSAGGPSAWTRSSDFSEMNPYPGCSFDPAVVAIDTLTFAMILTEPAEVPPTTALDAALPPADSLDLLTKAATELPDH